jgi:hypothetical protein
MKDNDTIEYLQQLIRNRLLDLESYINRSQRDKKAGLDYYEELIEERKKCREAALWLDKAVQSGII